MTAPLIALTCDRVETNAPWSALRQEYVDAIVAAGGAPMLIPLGIGKEAIERILPMLDGLVLTGGDDITPEQYGERPHEKLGRVNPQRDEMELELARRAMEIDLPTLGICRGIQLLAVAGGGTLYQDLPTQRPDLGPHHIGEHGRDHLAHDVDIVAGSRLAAALGSSRVRVNSLHHQAVAQVPPGFMVTAESGDGVVEGMERPDLRFVVALQCHPEGIWRTMAPEMGRLFSAFVDAARERQAAVTV